MTAAMQFLVQTVAERALNSIPEGLAIAGATWLLLRIRAGQHAGMKFLVWFVALIAVTALPLVPRPYSGLVGRPAESSVVLPTAWATAMFVIWLLLAGRAMARIVAGLWKVRRLRETSVELTGAELEATVRQTIAEIRVTRSIDVRISDAVAVPTAIGFFRPTILLPAWALEELSGQELKVVLFHEFAHLRRWDDWTNLAQKLVRTIFFFHPAVWWIERRLSLEREMACDDFVVAETANPRAYAECLVSMAERSVVRKGLALAQAVIGHARETAHRLARILDANRVRGNRSFKPAAGMAVVLAVISSIGVFYRPNIVSFEDDSPVPMLARAVTPPLLPDAAARADQAHASSAAIPLARKAALPKPGDRMVRVNQPVASKGVTASPLIARQLEDTHSKAQFVVVVQSTQFDGQSVTEQFCVWRVTVDPADRRVVHEELIVRSL